MSGIEFSKIIYWDACIYLAWLLGEEIHGKDCVAGIEQVVKENFAKNVTIVTSTITFVEVLSSKLSEDQERQFRKSFRNQDHVLRDVDPPVAMKAREFRNNFLGHESGKILATPDAIHLATAKIYSAEFWTFDKGEKGKHLGPLSIDGHEGVEGIKICKPYRTRPDEPETELLALG